MKIYSWMNSIVLSVVFLSLAGVSNSQDDPRSANIELLKGLLTSGLECQAETTFKYHLENRDLFAEPDEDPLSFVSRQKVKFLIHGEKYVIEVKSWDGVGKEMSSYESGFDGKTFYLLDRSFGNISLSSSEEVATDNFAHVTSSYEYLTLPLSYVNPPGVDVINPAARRSDSLVKSLQFLAEGAAAAQSKAYEGGVVWEIETEGNRSYPSVVTQRINGERNFTSRVVGDGSLIAGFPNEVENTVFLKDKPIRVGRFKIISLGKSAKAPEIAVPMNEAKNIRDMDAGGVIMER